MANDLFNESSFLWRVKIRADRPHTRLRQHAKCGTVLYELLGMLDKWAANDPQRFVCPHIKKLVAVCNKGKREDGVLYTERWVKYALAELRERHIISAYFRAHDGRYGFIVAPHDSLCHRDDDFCTMHAPKRFECSDEQAAQLRALVPEWQHQLPEPGQPIQRVPQLSQEDLARLPVAAHTKHNPWRKLHEHNAALYVKRRAQANPDLAPEPATARGLDPGIIQELSRSCPGTDKAKSLLNQPVAPSTHVERTLNVVDCTATAPQTSLVTSLLTSPETSPATSPEAQKNFTTDCTADLTTQNVQGATNQPVAESDHQVWFADGIESGLPIRSIHSSGGPVEPVSRFSRAPLDAAKGNPNTPSSFSQNPVNEKSNPNPSGHGGEKPKTIGDVFGTWTWEDMDELTGGELNTDSQAFQRYENKDELEAELQAVMDERKDQPFLGRETCASLMNAGMARLRKLCGVEAPSCWVPVIKSLRAKPEPESTESIADIAAIFTDPNPDRELCSDGIRRIESDRLHYGFTVKGADGVWSPPTGAVKSTGGKWILL